jgi:hypothetical protein
VENLIVLTLLNRKMAKKLPHHSPKVRERGLNLKKCVCNIKRSILHNEELSDLYSLPNIVWVVKSRRIRWAGHVARMGEGRVVCRVLVGKLEGNGPLGDPDVDGRIILRYIFRKLEGILRTGWSWFRTGTGGGHL